MVERTCLSVEEASESLGVSPRNVYRLINEQRLPYLRVGRRVVIPIVHLHEFISREVTLPETWASAP